MSKLLLLTYVFVLTCLYGHLPGQIPKNANTIVVKGVSFIEVCNKLLDSGYTLESKDAELQAARTEPKVYPRYWNAAYKILVRVKDSTAYFKGTFTSPYVHLLTKAANKTDPLFNNDPAYNHVNKKGMTYPKSIIGYPFLLINKFVLSFNKPVEYLKQ